MGVAILVTIKVTSLVLPIGFSHPIKLRWIWKHLLSEFAISRPTEHQINL